MAQKPFSEETSRAPISQRSQKVEDVNTSLLGGSVKEVFTSSTFCDL